jgi:hypothetical protein
MKIVINKCYGGFGLSFAAMDKLAERKGFKLEHRDGVNEYVLVSDPTPENLSMSSFALKENFGPVIGDDILNKADWFYDHDIERNDPDLVAVVEELGKESFGDFAELQVVEIPDDVNWKIEEYDGQEWVAEVHRTWS